ncbi:hypothetical protein CK203_080156 [Vitis vinifera]|uniref:Uncharacterized protein n=1 Tax=Vitis vinifera TaxID=29760 RepID=A0A438F2K0_VITVI|nr:hypothetical protein CK203_080156 [Vitis vinifera]
MQILLPRPVSDHCPILLDYGEIRTARKDAALEKLNYWDSLERLGSLSEEDRSSQQIARDEFSHCAILEEFS